MKYRYFLGGALDSIGWDKNQSWWRRILKKYVPCYHHEHDKATVKPIWRRWWLKISEYWVLLTDPAYRELSKTEMWTCHECASEIEAKHNGSDGSKTPDECGASPAPWVIQELRYREDEDDELVEKTS